MTVICIPPWQHQRKPLKEDWVPDKFLIIKKCTVTHFTCCRYRPAPFVMLDELDASLDGVNVRKVVQLFLTRIQSYLLWDRAAFQVPFAATCAVSVVGSAVCSSYNVANVSVCSGSNSLTRAELVNSRDVVRTMLTKIKTRSTPQVPRPRA